MARPRDALFFRPRSDPSLTLQAALPGALQKPRKTLKHLTLRLPIAYLLFRTPEAVGLARKIRAKTGQNQENQGQDNG
jgi:hypothetical protein